MDHAPDTGGDREHNPETMYGEWRDGRPDGGLRFPRDENGEITPPDSKPGEREVSEEDGSTSK